MLGVTTAATIHDGSPYAEQLQQVFVDEFAAICGGETTAQEAINVGDTQFQSVLTTIAADSPELLFYPIFSPEGPLITQQARGHRRPGGHDPRRRRRPEGSGLHRCGW